MHSFYQCEQSHDIGSKPLVIQTKLTREEVFEMMMERGRIFQLASVEWMDDGSGSAVIKLVPGNGMIRYQVHYGQITELTQDDSRG